MIYHIFVIAFETLKPHSNGDIIKYKRMSPWDLMDDMRIVLLGLYVRKEKSSLNEDYGDSLAGYRR